MLEIGLAAEMLWSRKRVSASPPRTVRAPFSAYAPPYNQARQPNLPAIIVAAQPAIAVVAAHHRKHGADVVADWIRKGRVKVYSV